MAPSSGFYEALQVFSAEMGRFSQIYRPQMSKEGFTYWFIFIVQHSYSTSARVFNSADVL